MRVDWVVPCRYCEIAGDGTMSVLGAGLDSYWLPDEQLPTAMGVFLATRVAGPEEEWATPTAFAVRLVRPDLEQEDMLEIPLQMPAMPPLKQPGHEAGMLLPLLMQWEAQEHGLYSFDLLLNGVRERSVPINIRSTADLPPQS